MPTIVAISRQFGSGGARIGRAVAQRLGYNYADREILAEAARQLEIDPADLEPLEERVASFWNRIGALFALGSPDTPYIPPSLPSITESGLAGVEQQIIRNIAARGRAVIVGRGAAHILKGSDVVGVFLHAPLAVRLDRAQSEYGLADAAAAAAVVADSDQARARFAREIAGRDWTDATLYDLCVDTSTVGLDRAVDLIVRLIEPPPASPLPDVASRSAGHQESR